MRILLLTLLLGLGFTNPVRAEVKITPDVVYGHKDGLALTMDVFQPEKNANGIGVLFMVSGGWYSRWAPPEQTMSFFRHLIDEGYTVFAVRHGSSPRYVVPEIVEDVRRSVRYVRLHADQFQVDADRLGVCGGSAGGHLSLILGTQGDDGDPDANDPLLRTSSRVAAIVAYFPPTDLRPYVKQDSPYRTNFPALQFEEEKADAVSPLLHASEDDPPTLLIHGDQDELVPLWHSEKMIDAFKEQSVTAELLVIENAAHGFAGKDAEKAMTSLQSWFDRHLAP